MARFPHMDGATAFPNIANVDVWKYQNEFDYKRWPVGTTLKVLNVPWCGDYENVVKFADDPARDAWFDAHAGETFTLDTMVAVLPEQSVKLPIPAPVLMGFNYLMVDLPRFTSEDQPVMYADGNFKRRYFYFIDTVSQRAANTTECVLRLDYWTTFINDLSFDYVMLERGHAPVAATDVDTYLNNPLDNSTYLLAPDVTFAQPRIAGGTNAVRFDDGDAYAVFLLSATFWDDWGDLVHPRVPASMPVWMTGVPGNYALAIDSTDFEAFMRDVDANVPQFMMCIKGVFFIAKKSVGVAVTVTFNGWTMYQLDSYWRDMNLIRLNRDQFGYPTEAADFAKLYTYPYAELVIADAQGNEQHFRIEDTGGSVDLGYCVQMVLPWVCIDTQLKGIGGGTSHTLQFSNIGSRDFSYTGHFWDTMRRLSIPIYSVTQSAYTHADYMSDYDREQAALEAQTALTNGNASAQTAHDNTVDTNNTAETNTNNSAANIVNNNAISCAANTNVTSIKNSAASEGAHASNANEDAATSWDNSMTTAGYQAQQDALAVAATNNNMQAGVAAVSNIATGVASVAGNVATGNVGGAVGAVASTIGSLAGTAVGWSAANSSNAVSQSNSDLVYNATISANTGKMTNNTSYTTQATDIQNEAAANITATQNDAQTSITANNAATMNTNAANTRATGNANADRTLGTQTANNQRTYDTAIAGIQARLNQAGVNPPAEFGMRVNGETATTRPLMVSATVVTQPKSAIMQVASAFARYGYQLNQQWRITDLQVMKHFTYWQCSEVWCTGTGNAVEVSQQAIKDIMARGVTVWSAPEEIGTVSIYDN